MDNYSIKNRVIILAILIFSMANLFSLDTTRLNQDRYSIVGNAGDYQSDGSGSSENSRYAIAVPVDTGFRAHTPETADEVATGKRVGYCNCCARLCAYLFCQKQDSDA